MQGGCLHEGDVRSSSRHLALRAQQERKSWVGRRALAPGVVVAVVERVRAQRRTRRESEEGFDGLEPRPEAVVRRVVGQGDGGDDVRLLTVVSPPGLTLRTTSRERGLRPTASRDHEPGSD